MMEQSFWKKNWCRKKVWRHPGVDAEQEDPTDTENGVSEKKSAADASGYRTGNGSCETAAGDSQRFQKQST